MGCSFFFFHLSRAQIINPGRHGVFLLMESACMCKFLSEGDVDHGGDGAVGLAGCGGGGQSCDLQECELLVYGLEEVGY